MGLSRKKDIPTPSVFAKRAASYFRDCDMGSATAACDGCEAEFGGDGCVSCRKKQSRPYTLSGLCLALGVTKKTFEALKKNKDYAEAVEMALLRIEAYMEENSIAGQIGGTLALAVMKEHFGWGEKKKEEAGQVEILLSEEAKSLAK